MNSKELGYKVKHDCAFCGNRVNLLERATFGRNKKPCHTECYGMVLQYAKHYHNPISDFRGFWQSLSNDTGLTATKEQIAEMLGFI